MPRRQQRAASNTQGHAGLIGRRDLLANAALVGAGVAFGSVWFAACADQSKDSGNRGDQAVARRGHAMKTRKLGTLEVSEMSAGCMSISQHEARPEDGSPSRIRSLLHGTHRGECAGR